MPQKKIADDPKDEAVMPFNGLIQDGVVTRKQPWHLFGILLREPGAAFDVGKEEGDSAGRERVMVSHLKH